MLSEDLEYAARGDVLSPHVRRRSIAPRARDLRSYVLLGLVAALATAGTAFAVASAQPQEYRASAELLLRPSAGLSAPLEDRSGDPERDIQTQVQILQSRPVADVVRGQLGEAVAVDVAPVGRSNILQVTARGTNPSRAASVANAYADAYLAYRAETSAQMLFTVQGELGRQVAALEQEIGAAENQLAVAARSHRLALLATRDQLLAQQSVLAERAADLRLQTAFAADGPEVLVRAAPPRSGARPDPMWIGALGAVVGLVLGIGLAIALAERQHRRAADDMDSAGG